MTRSQRPTDHPPTPEVDTEPHSDFGSTPRARSWLWPVAGVIVVLVAVVVVGKLGPTPGETLPEPSARPAAQMFVPGRSLTPVAHPGASSSSLPGYRIGIRSGDERYDDGIPASLDGNQVVRVRDAASLPVGSTVLVGGWVQRPSCTAPSSACPATLSDGPFQSSRTITVSLVGQAAFEDAHNARIYLASVQDDLSCTYSVAETCLPELSVGEALWSGDGATTTAPFTPAAVLGDVAERFPELEFKPFEESSYCPLMWPYQAYIATSPTVPRAMWTGLPIRLVVVYPSPEERIADGNVNRVAAAGMSAFDASNRCVSIPGGLNDRTWVVRDNVMVLTGLDSPEVRTQLEAILDSQPARN